METVPITLDLGDTEARFVALPKTFSSGSRGYHAAGKAQTDDGTRYQVNLMLVEIGSKPAAEE